MEYRGGCEDIVPSRVQMFAEGFERSSTTATGRRRPASIVTGPDIVGLGAIPFSIMRSLHLPLRVRPVIFLFKN